MTVELRTLRVAPQLSEAGYVASARNLEAANEGMSTSAKMVSVSLGETAGQATRAKSPIESLSRQFIDGYGSTVRFETGLRNINMALEKGAIDATRAEAIYSGMTTRLGLMANGTDVARQGYATLGAVIDNVNAKLSATELAATRATAAASRVPAAINDNLPMVDPGARFRRQGLMYQGFDIGTSLAGGINPAMVAVQQGPQILQMYAGNGGVTALLKDAGYYAGVLATRLGPVALAAGAGALAVREMQEDIERATGRSVTFGQTFSAAIRTIADDITDVLQPAIDALFPPIQYAVERLSSAAVDLAEWTANAFRAAYKDVLFLWEQFPNLVGAGVLSVVNSMATALDRIVKAGADKIDALIAKVNTALAMMNEYTGTDWQIPPIGYQSDGRTLPNTYLEEFQRANEAHRREIEGILGSNPIRDYFDDVARRAGDRISGEAGAGKGADPWFGLREQSKAAREEIDALADAMKRVDDLRADLAFEREQMFRTPGERAIASRLRGTNLGMDSPEAQLMRDMARFEELRDLAKGFFSDFRAGLMEGEKFGEAFGNALLNALNKKLDSWAEAGIDALSNSISSLFGISGGGAGATLGSSIASGASSLVTAGGSLLAAANSNVSRSGDAVDIASGLLGFTEAGNRGSINAFLKQGGVDIDAAQTAWCAGFVNSSLERVGVTGTGSLLANSFLDWGKAINPSDVLKGDILVQSNGFGSGSRGGHVGFATGATRMGANGLQLEMLSGNNSNAVGTDWRDAMVLDVRRAQQSIAGLGSTAQMATQGLGGFGGALNQLGQMLNGVGGNGGWFSGLMGMFGGATGAMTHMLNLSPLATGFLARGGVGLFANGGVTDRPAIFGEAGIEAAVPLPDGRRIPVDLRTPATNSSPSVVMGNISVGVSVDDDGKIKAYVRDQSIGIAERTSKQAIHDYDYRQKQGGQAQTQQRYAALKRR